MRYAWNYLRPCKLKNNASIPTIRFDFESLTTADPVQGTSQATAASATAAIGGSIGDCATDQFSITGPKQSSPVICGTNTGQHSN